MFIFAERIRFKERHDLMEDRIVAGGAYVMRSDEGEPEQIVRHARAHARTGLGMPPVLHVALDELPRGRAQDVFARELRCGMHERHHILELVAESEGTARLVKGRASPDAAAQRLVEQPAIEQEIGGGLGRLHLDRAEEIVPPALRPAERGLDICRSAEALHDRARLGFIGGLSEQEGHFDHLARLDLHDGLHRGAWVEARARAAHETLVLHRGGIAHRAVAPDENGAVASVRIRSRARRGEGHAVAEFRLVGVARKEAAALQIPLRHDVHPRFLRIAAEHERGVGSDGELAAMRRAVAQPETLHAHGESAGGIHGHKGEQLLLDGVAVVLADRVSLAVPRAVGIDLADRLRRGRPEDAEIVIANVDRATRRIRNRIVRPRREAMALAVAVPGEARAGFRDERAEGRIRHHIHPRRGRLRAGAEVDGVFLSVLREATEAVEIIEFQERQRRRHFLAIALPRRTRHRLRTERHRRGQLLPQRAARGDKHGARRGHDHGEFVLGNLLRRAQKNATGLIHAGDLRVGFREPPQLRGERFLVALRLLADEHEIDLQPAQMPERVCRQHLAHERDVAVIANRHRDDRQVARDALRPERTLARGAAPEPRRWRPQSRLWEKHVRGELLEKLHIAGADAEPAHLELRARPRSLEGARGDAEFRVALDQSDDRRARFGDHGDDRELEALIRRDRHLPAQAEDRIEDGAGGVRKCAPDGFRILQRATATEKTRTVCLKLR